MSRSHGPRRLAARAVLFLCTIAAAAAAHWLKPEEIVGGLKNNPHLHEKVGIVDVYRDPKLDRLLIIKVDRARWLMVPADDRLRMAQDWGDTWSHNVDQGIVGIIDAVTETSLVHYDATGRATLKDSPAP